MPTARVSTVDCNHAPGMHLIGASSQAYGERIFYMYPIRARRARPTERHSPLGGRHAGDVRIDVDPFPATYLVFLHAIEDRPVPEPAGFAPMGPAPLGGRNDGNELGRRVSDYIPRLW